jgi:hypothetical protein
MNSKQQGGLLVAGISLLIGLTLIVNAGRQSYLTCTRAPSGTVDCRVEERIYDALAWGDPIIIESVGEADAARICETVTNSEGDTRQECSWQVVLHGAGGPEEMRGFDEANARATAGDFNAYVTGDAPTFEAISRDPGGRTLLFVLLGGVTLLGLGSLVTAFRI